MTFIIAAIVMTLSVLEGHSLLRAFSSAIFRIHAICMVPFHLQSVLWITALILLVF